MPDPVHEKSDKVRLLSAPEKPPGLISGPAERRQGQWWYPVFFTASDTGTYPEEDLVAFTGTGDLRSLIQEGHFGGREALSRLVTHLKLTTDLRSQIYALFASRTHFYPYQFKPLLKFLESRNNRLLIADEVGLGKTIEAGLILTELRHRRPDLSRVLLVPPAHLRRKWQEEMRRRFDREFRVLDSRGVQEFLREYEREGLETELWGIVSLQTLRGARVMERWEEVGPEIDFVVFDEAGRFRNHETRSHRAANLVAESADAVLLLTATPVQTGAQDLFNLLRILDPEVFDRYEVFDEQLRANEHVLSALSALRDPNATLSDAMNRLRQVETSTLATRFRDSPLYQELLERLPQLGEPSRLERIELQRDLAGLSVFGHVLSRTRKREVETNQPERRVRIWPCEPTDAERDFYKEVTDICREAYAWRVDRRGTSFGIMQPQRQMASCMVGMVDYVADQLSGRLEPELESADLDVEDEENSEGDERAEPRWHELGDLELWRRRLRERDSKLEGLISVLRTLDAEEPRAKVIVFTFFHRTVSYLSQQLAERDIHALTLTGLTLTDPDNPELDERLQTIERFRRDSAARVLIATEVADEGLDFQFAHCMVNYDLPWNPMRIEQRIGRIDRIGQQAKAIEIINLSMPGTIEDRIMELLHERIRIFERSIGDLESIVGEVIDELQRDLFAKDLSPEEEVRHIQQAADVIERRTQDSDRLQNEAEALIGHDEFFQEEIERARTRRRYLSGEELLIYLRDFLADHHKTCRIRQEEARDTVYHLGVTEPLRQFIRGALPQGDRELAHFLARCASGELRFTTSTEVAEEDPQLDFLTFYHPVIRAVNRHYEDNGEELHPVSHVRVRTGEVPPGTYAWLLFLMEITGARPTKDLELVAIDLGNREVLDEDASEVLLWQVVAEAESVSEAMRHPGVPDQALDTAEETLVARLDAKFEERKRLNEALVANRLASLRETFERNLELRRQRLEEARARRRQESYIKGLGTRVRNLKTGYEAKRAEIEDSRSMSRSYNLRGAGVVEVVHVG